MTARGGRVTVDPATGRTDNPRVWAGGDVVNGGREVVNAVQDGKVAARSIAAALGVTAAPARIEISAAPTPGRAPGVSLAIDLAGIRSPNPFWLASAPPTNTGEMVARAFDAGWGGAVWKTVGEPITQRHARASARIDVDGRRMVGINNIELITDRPIEVNLAEIREVKRRYPERAVVVSLMVESKREAWHDIVSRVNDTGADGIELNFGCPHGMSERGMGSAVGQVPEYIEMITELGEGGVARSRCSSSSRRTSPTSRSPRGPRSRAAPTASRSSTRSARSSGVDLDTLVPRPSVRGRGSHGGYCGPAVKPIALNMVSAIASDPRVDDPDLRHRRHRDLAGRGRVHALGATTVQVCTAVMHYGFRIVEDMIDGLAGYLDGRGPRVAGRPRGPRAARRSATGATSTSITRSWRGSTPTKCIHCNLCYRGLRGRRPPGDPPRAHERPRRRLVDRRRRVRGLPALPARLPGRRLHHDGRGRRRRAPARVGETSRDLSARAITGARCSAPWLG